MMCLRMEEEIDIQNVFEERNYVKSMFNKIKDACVSSETILISLWCKVFSLRVITTSAA